jgi:rRNA maturation protein Nop10
MGDRASGVWPTGVKPNIGDLASAKSIGRMGRAIHIWEACPKCGHERWIKRNAKGTCCQTCMHPPIHYGADNNRWNLTKRTVTKSGVRVYITSGHPFFSMAHRYAKYGYAILEHRLIMATHLGRPLESWEVVHHIDGDNCNNAMENLLLLPHRAMHSAYTLLQVEVRKLQARVTLLEADNTLLREQLSRLGQGNPELAEDNYPRASVETLHGLPHEGKEKVQPPEKSEEQ